jgi:hypothetical protein
MIPMAHAANVQRSVDFYKLLGSVQDPDGYTLLIGQAG